MYTNNKMINAFFFFSFLSIIIQCFFAPLISAGGSQLSVDYYKKSCPYVDDIVFLDVWRASIFDPRMPASLLRLFFHDCFVNGCDASVLLDATHNMKSEKTAGPNINSLRGFEVIDTIKADVEKECPNIVSCADILTLAARAAVQIALSKQQYYNNNNNNDDGFGPQILMKPWDVVLGRYDGMTANLAGANSNLPSPTDSVNIIINKFAAQGLDTKDVVVLSGAHTIGNAHCSTIKGNRLYPSKKTKTYKMDAGLLSDLRKNCTNDKSSDNCTVFLDWDTPYAFDNVYYCNLVNNKGVLLSDEALMFDGRTSGLVKFFCNNQESFIYEFGRSMVKMSNISIITKGGKVKGEIRKNCGFTNK